MDDTTFVSDDKEKLQHLLKIIANESKEKGICISIKKTECIIISKKKTTPTCKIYIHSKIIRQVESFDYLGSIVTFSGKCDEDIKKKFVLAKPSFTRMSNILKSGIFSMETKLRFLNCYVFSILTYGNECWTILRTIERRTEAAGMWFY